jgi:signal transduction histidine kinase
VGALTAQFARNPQSLPPLGGALVQLGLAIFLLLKRGDRALRGWFIAVACASAVWSFTAAYALAAEHAAHAALATRFAYVAICLAGPCSLNFATTLTRVRHRFAPISLAIAAVAGAVIFAAPGAVSVARRGGGYYPTLSAAIPLLVVSVLPPMIFGIHLIRRAVVALPPCRRRRQLAWAGAAMLVAVAGATDLRTLIDRSYPVGWATGSLSCATLYYAVVQHRLMAIHTLARQTVLGLLGALAAAVGIFALVRGLDPAPSTAVPLVAVAVIFVVVRVWLSTIEPALTRLVGARRRAIDRAWAEFERRALEARTTDDVHVCLQRALHDGLDVELRALYTADSEWALVAAEARLRTPALRDLLDLDDEQGKALCAALDVLRADALVPLERDGTFVGVAALAGRALTRADDELADDLQHLGALGARAFINARLYEEVARRQEGLEEEVRERTAELQEALDDLKDAQAKLVEAERSSSLGLLVAGISHEINNALNFISANLPTLRRYAGAYETLLDRAGQAGGAPAGRDADAVATARAELPRSIATVEAALRRIGAIVADLRKFARPDTERRLVRVEEGLDAALNLLRRRTDGRLDVVRLYLGAPSVEGYPGPLNQCFFNLLLNAVEAARDEVWVVLRSVEEQGVELSIRDDGRGIPSELRPYLFRPFFTTKPYATGLGLAVSRGIVERHGGTIELDSEPGEGALVRVRLPARAPEPKGAPA